MHIKQTWFCFFLFVAILVTRIIETNTFPVQISVQLDGGDQLIKCDSEETMTCGKNFCDGYAIHGQACAEQVHQLLQQQASNVKEQEHAALAKHAQDIEVTPKSSQGVAKTCDVNSDLLEDGVTCVPKCPEHASRVDGVCRCDDGFIVGNGGTACILSAKCPANSVFRDGDCHCIDGYQLSEADNQCVQVPQCPNHSSFVHGTCRCSHGYEPVDGQCMQVCPANSVRDSNDPNTCSCIEGFKPSADGIGCQKQAPACPMNSHFDFSSKSCVCDEQYELRSDKQACIQKCPLNAIRNDQGVCVCKSGFGPSPDRTGCVPLPL